MRNNLGNKARLHHILDAIQEVEMYVNNSTFDEFVANSMMKSAVIKQLEVIGEACSRVSESVKLKYQDVKWRDIVGLRNLLIHEYFGVDEFVIWGVIKKDIPELKVQVNCILDEYPDH